MAYALRHWLEYYVVSSPDIEVDRQIVSILESHDGHYLHLLWYLMPAASTEPRPAYLQTYSSLHLAQRSLDKPLFRILARGSYPRLVEAKLSSVSVSDVVGDSPKVTALSWAVICQRRECFHRLFQSSHVEHSYNFGDDKDPLDHAADAAHDRL